jgi:hypothetical protein|tara:strand:- start:895 stop:1431 length:537 start_codon:yes stop_codon:yes gene_type:complete
MISGNEWWNWAIQNVPNEPRTTQGYRHMLAYTKSRNPPSASHFLENFLYVYRDEWKPELGVKLRIDINNEIAWMENAKNEYDSMLIAKNKIQIKNQEITFNEQVNSGDFNETPITDVNLSSGCSECIGEKLTDPIIKKGYHTMPDGSLMKDTDMEKGNNMKIVGIAAIGLIGLMVLKK